jgi:hypothetical protein
VWLDGAVAETYQGQPLAQDWARVAKVMEEAGEAIAALIACTGQNPRKGVCGTQDDMLSELADTAMTAIFGIQHFTKDARQTWAIVSAAMAKAHARALAAKTTGFLASQP